MNTPPHIIEIETVPERLTRRFFAPAVIILLVLAPAAGAECPPRFEITLIEGPDCGIGPTDPHAYGINDLGHVVGNNGCHAGAERAIAWYGEDPAVLLDEPPATNRSRANNINSLGWIVGSAEITTAAGTRGVIWHDGVIDVIEPFEGDYHTATGGVNALGHVVAGSGQRALLWIDGVITNLHDLVKTAPESVAADINDLDQIVGWLDWPGPDNEMAMLIDGDSVIELGHLPGGTLSKAYSINNEGVIVGAADSEDGIRGFYWSDEELTALGVVDGYADSIAYDINDNGWIAGECYDPGKAACLWTDPNTQYLLRDLIVQLDEFVYLRRARAINNAGQITGDASQLGYFYAYVVTPIPPVAGDLDCDRIVGFADLLTVLSWWGLCPEECSGDADDNGVVDSFDVLVVLGNWS